jgi:hypothetical protein
MKFLQSLIQRHAYFCPVGHEVLQSLEPLVDPLPPFLHKQRTVRQDSVTSRTDAPQKINRMNCSTLA